MFSLIIKLLLAHTIGDFVLQPSKWVEHKRQKKHKSVFLYLHILIHVLVLLILLQFDWKYGIAYILIPVSHFLIDLIKLHKESTENSRILFLTDQGLHLAIIAVVVYIYEPYQFDLQWIYSTKILLLVFTLSFLTIVTSIVMKVIMSQWKVEEGSESLNNAGKYIGILERLFVFGFIVLQQWQAIGLLIAAKSVFRFGDLTRAKDRKLTEYILIGTLLSFGIAIFTGIIYQYVQQQMIE